MRQRAARAPSVAPEGDSSWFREEHVPFLSPPFSSLALACLEAVCVGGGGGDYCHLEKWRVPGECLLQDQQGDGRRSPALMPRTQLPTAAKRAGSSLYCLDFIALTHLHVSLLTPDRNMNAGPSAARSRFRCAPGKSRGAR